MAHSLIGELQQQQRLVKFARTHRLPLVYALLVVAFVSVHYWTFGSERGTGTGTGIGNIDINIGRDKQPAMPTDYVDHLLASHHLSDVAIHSRKLLGRANAKSRQSRKRRSAYRRNVLIYSSSWSSQQQQQEQQALPIAPEQEEQLASETVIKCDRPVAPLTERSNDIEAIESTSRFYSQIMQDRLLVHLLNSSSLRARNGSRDGLFVEAGAFDGLTWSNTLHLERALNWTGLLIEPSTDNYAKLVHESQRTRAYSINSCLAQRDQSSAYIEAGPFGITTNLTTSSSAGHTLVCHPFVKLLDAFFDALAVDGVRRSHSRIAAATSSSQSSRRVVDYLSLDIEGGERAVLETFPWHAYQFNLLNIEFNQNQALHAWIVEFMAAHGYVETLVDDVWYQDVYLAHSSVYGELNLEPTRRRVSDFTVHL